jgi:hypothetical protein
VREVRAFSAGGRESSLKEKEPSGTLGPDLPHAMGYGLMPLAISGVGSPADGRRPPVRQGPDASLRASPPLPRSAHRSRGHRPTHAGLPLLANPHEPLSQSTRHRDPVSLSSATPGSQGLARPSGNECIIHTTKKATLSSISYLPDNCLRRCHRAATACNISRGAPVLGHAFAAAAKVHSV